MTTDIPATPPLPAVAVLGTGTMGSAFASNLLRAGFRTVVWNRTPAAVSALAELGAVVAGSPAEAVRSAGVAITMVSDGEAVREVAVDRGMLAGLAAGAVWAQMGTIGVAATDRMTALTAALRPDVAFVDAPVSGSKVPAEQGELLVLASGPPRAVEVVEPVFSVLGRRTVWLGAAGRGSRMKLVVNSWLAVLVEGMAESAALADRLGIASDELRDALDGGALAAPLAVAKLAKLTAGDYAPEFSLAWALKDVDLSLVSDPRPLPALAAIAEQWHRAADDGLGRLDVAAARLALDPSGSMPGKAAVEPGPAPHAFPRAV
jgi:3-hydroxyisobutyrate dehydrogenase